MQDHHYDCHGTEEQHRKNKGLEEATSNVYGNGHTSLYADVIDAIKIAGAKWNAADTYYTIRNKVIPGSAINASRIEKGMAVWMKSR